MRAVGALIHLKDITISLCIVTTSFLLLLSLLFSIRILMNLILTKIAFATVATAGGGASGPKRSKAAAKQELGP